MKNVDLEGYYKTDEGIPAFVYDVQLREGQDFSGKFGVQFAAVSNDAGDAKFAVVVQGQSPPFVIDWTAETREMVADLIETRKVIACINYENTGWEEPGGGYASVLMGRDFGEQFDVVQRLDLSTQDVAALREIRDALDERYGFDS